MFGMSLSIQFFLFSVLIFSAFPGPHRSVMYMGVYTVTESFKFLALFKVAKGIEIFCTLSHCSISNESISSLSFNCGHDLRNALSGVGTVNAG